MQLSTRWLNQVNIIRKIFHNNLNKIMNENQRFILDVDLTQDDIDHAAFAQNLLHAKSIVLTTESSWIFQLLLNYPRLYQIFLLLPQVKEDKSRFGEYIKNSIEKNTYIKAQNFELAGKYRVLETEVAQKIIADCKLKSFNVKELVLKRGAIRLFVILLIC